RTPRLHLHRGAVAGGDDDLDLVVRFGFDRVGGRRGGRAGDFDAQDRPHGGWHCDNPPGGWGGEGRAATGCEGSHGRGPQVVRLSGFVWDAAGPGTSRLACTAVPQEGNRTPTEVSFRSSRESSGGFRKGQGK